jgi:NADPH-dependent 2,4-dienoyl-CoA reductase/sulfur reductase-like enzyme
LVGAFLSPLLNKRTDSYGGSLKSRLNFLLDVIKGIRADVGKDFPVVVRISGDDRIPGGRTLQETQFIAPMIVKAGASALEISGGTVPDAFWAVVPPTGTPLALNADSAAAVKQVAAVPVICVGRINDPHIAQFVLETGKADMVSMGRALIADPELPRKVYEGHFEDIRPCVADNQGCLGVPTVQRETSCIVNPAVGRERQMEIVPADVPRNVMVVGGGPSGMEAARVASKRGHAVTLIEKEEKLGGQINLAGIPPSKQEMCKLVKYLSVQMEKAGVTIQTGREASASFIKKAAPDVVVVATGGSPIIPDDIPGINKDRVVTAWDVLAGKTRLDGNVVILGGGSVGCETADFLVRFDDNFFTGRKTVTILEVQTNVAMDMSIQSRHLLMQRLRKKGVRFITSCKVLEILDDNAIKITKEGNEEIMRHADHVVLALGAKAVSHLSDNLKGKVDEIYVIGDAKRPRGILEAIAEGAEIARTI